MSNLRDIDIMGIEKKYFITIIVLFYCVFSIDFYNLDIQSSSQGNQVLLNNVDSVTLHCAFFSADQIFDLFISNSCIRLRFPETDSCVIFMNNSIDRNKLVSYVNDFFILKREKIYYKISHEAWKKYIITDYPIMIVRVYKKRVVLKRFYVATRLWRESGDTIVMYDDSKTYHYNRKFIDFYNLLDSISR